MCFFTIFFLNEAMFFLFKFDLGHLKSKSFPNGSKTPEIQTLNQLHSQKLKRRGFFKNLKHI
jgi:hypothetical protein